MKPPQKRSWRPFRMLDLAALALGGLLTWAAADGWPPRVLVAPRRPVPPPQLYVIPGPAGEPLAVAPYQVNGQATDRCLVPVDVSALDPKFVVPAPRTGDRMAVPARVVGLPAVRR